MSLKKITVLSPSFALTSIVAVSSALAKIAQAFPEVSVASVQMLTALPSLIAIAVILFSGYLSSWITKKRIVAISMGFMLLGGLLPVFLHRQFRHLVLASVLFGLGYGGISPLTTALIHDHYSPEEQPAMLGLQSAVIGIGGVLFSFLGGKLAAVRWWYAYYSYLLFIPVLILVLLLPKGSTSPRPAGGHLGKIWNRRLLFYVAQSLLFGIFFFVFQTNIALLVESRGLGSSVAAGSVLSTQSAFGILSGILGGKILGRLKRFALPTIFLVSGSAFLVIFLAGGLGLIYLAAACLGFFFSLRMPAGYLKATASTAPEYATLAITVYCSSSQVGQFLSPVCINRICGAFGLALDEKFLLSSFFLILIGVISLFWERNQAPRREKAGSR